MTLPPLTDNQFETLGTLVEIARSEQVRTLVALKKRAEELGHTPEDIEAACLTWREHLRDIYPDAYDLKRATDVPHHEQVRLHPQRLDRPEPS